MTKHTYKLYAGRCIVRDCTPVATLRLCTEEGTGRPCIEPIDADTLARTIVDALNAPQLIYQVWFADNDRNGNPRRLTMIYNACTGGLVAARDHGYSGDMIPRDSVTLCGVQITGKEYRKTLKAYAERTALYVATVRKSGIS